MSMHDEGGVFADWGRWVFRHRWVTIAACAALLAASVAVLAQGATLSSGTIVGTESDRALRLMERELGRPVGSTFTLVAHAPAYTADDPRFREALDAAVAPLRRDRRVASVRTAFDAPGPMGASMRSRDGHRVLAFVALRADAATAAREYPSIRASIRPPPGLDVSATGSLAFRHDLDSTLEADLMRAEIVSMPLALVVLLLVFGSLVAASVPLGVGGLAVVGGVAGVFLLSRAMDVAQYAINIVTLIGLGVAIDYSLFVVDRFRGALDEGRSTEDAVAHATATAGRAVAFSGIAVAIGLSGLLFYRGSYLSSMGVAGAIVVAFAVFYSLTFLPALLGALGPKIRYGRIPFTAPGMRSGFWHRLAMAVMARPVLVLLPTLALLLFIGTPFARLQTGAVQVTALPPRAEARRAHEVMAREFPEQAMARVVVVAHYPTGRALTAERIGHAYDLSREVARVPGVVRVESVVNGDPSIPREMYQMLATAPPEQLPPEAVAALRESVGEHVIVLAALVRGATSGAEARAVVDAIRARARVPGGEVLVTGQAAVDHDNMRFIIERTPTAILFIVLMTYFILFLLLRSVVLPLKAVVMNLLSITGSFGALVWIFQEGHLRTVFKFEPGPIEPSLPVILFCTVFGLSMDYEVLLLSRMQEEYLRTGDNTHAVAEGLERSGRLITSAAAIMVAVFTAFALAEVVVIKAVGLGMAIAVALDATLVRTLVVPSTMRLFGDLNWWAPGSLARQPIERAAAGSPSSPPAH